MRQVVFVATTFFFLACGPDPNARLPGETVTPSQGGSGSGSGGAPSGTGGAISANGGNPFSSGAGGSPFGSGGAASSGGVASTGGDTSTGGAIGTDDGGEGSEPCVPVQTITGTGSASSGNFGTVGEFCFRTPDNINGWGCSNLTGRTLKVNGVTETCGALPLPPKVNGYYYFDASAGSVDYASIYWF